MVKEEYARGWDSKLQEDATVLVFDSKECYNLSTVVQMAGRGNRRKGETQATYYTTALVESSDVVEYLKKKEKEFADHADISRAFWEAWKTNEVKKKGALALFAESYNPGQTRKFIRQQWNIWYYLMFPDEKPPSKDEKAPVAEVN